MANARRYRYRSTDHYRETYDHRYERHWDVETGAVFIDRSRNYPLEQWYYSPDQFCIDTVGFRENDNPFHLSNERTVPPVISYTAEHTWDQQVGGVPNGIRQLFRRSYEGWMGAGHVLALDEPDESDVEFVTRAVGSLNPSRSDFQAAVFLAELRDLPSLFKNVGEELASQGLRRGSANQYLKGQYGWRPLIRDLRSFFNQVDKVQRRMKTLKELRGRGIIRRQFKEKDGRGTRIKFKNDYLGDVHSLGVHPFNEDIIRLRAFTEMRTTRWCDVEFVLDTPNNLFAPLDSELWDEAHSLVYGTTIDGPALWAAMPWSWLIDWSTNMTDYIKSQSNTVGAKFSKAVLMKTTERYTTVYPEWDDYPNLNGEFHYTFQPGRVETITKERILDIVPEAVTTTEAIIGDSFRSSILGALGIQRFRAPRF